MEIWPGQGAFLVQNESLSRREVLSCVQIRGQGRRSAKVDADLLTLSVTAVRRLNLVRQHLAGPPIPPQQDGVFRIVRDLGYLQLDPTSAVARSHLLVLWSRLGLFDPELLENLRWRQRELVEYAALIVPSQDLPIYRARMRQFATGDSPWPRRVRGWLEQNRALRRYILTTLRRRGPLASHEFEDRATAPWRSTGWTAGRNVSRMLEFLGASGKIMVAGRRSGQRLWDLAERVTPEWVPRRNLSDQEATRRRTLNALASLGVATVAHLRAHYVGPRTKDVDGILSRLQREEEIVPVRVVADGTAVPGAWWMRTADLPLLPQVSIADDWLPRTTLLSPFDNLIINRGRAEQLFDFHFRMEIYVPRAKRRYGYFVMPILHGDRLIGRLDPTFDRTAHTLAIRALHLEPGFRLTAGSAKAVVGAIENLGQFLSATNVAYGSRVPPAIRRTAR